MADTVSKIKADTPEDFLDGAHDAIGDGEALGVTTFDLSGTKWKTKGGKVTGGELKVTTSVTRATWAGPASSGTKFSKEIAKAQTEINAWIPAHEKKHVKLATDIVAKAKAAFQKKIVGKTEDEAQKLLNEIEKDINDAYEKLDAKEGKLIVTKSSSGAYNLKAVGV